jgi:hypothetical protein
VAHQVVVALDQALAVQVAYLQAWFLLRLALLTQLLLAQEVREYRQEAPEIMELILFLVLLLLLVVVQAANAPMGLLAVLAEEPGSLAHFCLALVEY